MEKFISIIIAVAVLLSTVCINAFANTLPQFTDASLNIAVENGDIVVNGSFTSDSATDMKYKVILAFYKYGGILERVCISEGKSISEGKNTVSYNAGSADDAKITKAFLWTENLQPIYETAAKVHSLKVLAIGNSFSIDAMQYLYDIADSLGAENIVLGNMYLGSCTIDTHLANAQSGEKAYTYYKNTTGEWETTKNQDFSTILTDEDWELITMQQRSANSGQPETYSGLGDLIDFVNKNKTNPDAQLAWHMTWAYQSDKTNDNFAYYNNDQMTMYNAILSTMKSDVYPKEEIEFIIPVGTAIQNVRTSFVGDTLAEDKYTHLNMYGDFVAGLTWYHKITTMPVDGLSWVPDETVVTSGKLKAVKESVKNAVLYPEKVTQSVLLTEPGAPENIVRTAATEYLASINAENLTNENVYDTYNANGILLKNQTGIFASTALPFKAIDGINDSTDNYMCGSTTSSGTGTKYPQIALNLQKARSFNKIVFYEWEKDTSAVSGVTPPTSRIKEGTIKLAVADSYTDNGTAVTREDFLDVKNKDTSVFGNYKALDADEYTYTVEAVGDYANGVLKHTIVLNEVQNSQFFIFQHAYAKGSPARILEIELYLN